MADIFNMLDTWNAAGTVFTGIKLNVTDTASAAGSLLMDLQVGGTTRFSVSKTGTIRVAEGSYPATTNLFGTSANGIGIYQNFITIVSNNTQAAWVSGTGLSILPAMTYAWANNGATPADLFLARDAANTLAQRNGVNAQAFNLYNSFTDVSNYERGFMRFVSNVLQIGSEKLGTGTARALVFQTDGVTRMTLPASGGVDITAGRIDFGGGSRLWSLTNGIFGVTSSSNTPANLLFGIFASSAETRLKPSGTTLQVRLGDDSAFTNIQGKLTTDTAYTAGAPTATGYITLYDSTGTAYRVPCVV